MGGIPSHQASHMPRNRRFSASPPGVNPTMRGEVKAARPREQGKGKQIAPIKTQDADSDGDERQDGFH